MSDKVLKLNADNFEETIKDGVCLVDFWAEWCGPCKMQLPILDKVAEKAEGKAKICKLNVDESPQVAAKFGIRSIPTLIVFKDGKAEKNFLGVQNLETLSEALGL